MHKRTEMNTSLCFSVIGVQRCNVSVIIQLSSVQGSSSTPVLSNADGLVDLHSSGVSVDDLWALRASDLLFPHVI